MVTFRSETQTIKHNAREHTFDMKSLIHVGLKVLGMVHDVDEVIVAYDVSGIDWTRDPADEPDDESKDEERNKDPADDAAALIHLALLPVIAGSASYHSLLCVWVDVHFLKDIIFILQQVHLYSGSVNNCASSG